jgi:hypothetical protein
VGEWQRERRWGKTQIVIAISEEDEGEKAPLCREERENINLGI